MHVPAADHVHLHTPPRSDPFLSTVIKGNDICSLFILEGPVAGMYYEQ